MKIIRQIQGMREVKLPVFLAAGFFDGVHRGHRKVLQTAILRARAAGGEAWAMTFDPHPMKILDPSAAPLLLTSTRHKLALMQRMGLHGCLLIPFTRRFASMQAREFLDAMETNLPTLRHILVGEDWRFGKGGGGNTALLDQWARLHGIVLERIPPVTYRRDPVSSTRIRETIAKGQLQAAAMLLDRPFSILGVVTRGNRIGRKLGFPTANIDPQSEVRPPMGVYAVHAITGGAAFAGIVNYGYHPTIHATRAPLIELHLLDTRRRLYGRHVEIFFMARLRSERHFSSTAALVNQIRRDIAAVRRKLAAPALKKLWNRTLQTWHSDIIVAPQNKKRKKEERE